MRRAWPWVVLVVCLAVGLGEPRWTAARTADRYPVTAADLADGQAALASLPVADLDTTARYDRAQFGQAWADTDGNGCGTRDDVLLRDLADPRVDADGCRVLSGTLDDPYTGERIDFVRGASSHLVQIDHVVALSDAWKKGAQGWDAARRLAFANDPANLLAVQGAANQRKGDSDASEWLPRPGFRCVYALVQVRVKAAYGLWVTDTEKSAMSRALSGCRTVDTAQPGRTSGTSVPVAVNLTPPGTAWASTRLIPRGSPVTGMRRRSSPSLTSAGSTSRPTDSPARESPSRFARKASPSTTSLPVTDSGLSSTITVAVTWSPSTLISRLDSPERSRRYVSAVSAVMVALTTT
ncbi:MAG: DUF1524 domain-containing protein [Micrococcales bacterium]|nr:DUF1524 domain-containing protein [Micrococcales bacterium]